MSDQSSKVPVTTGGAIKSFVPQSLDEAWRLAKAFHAGGIAPSSFRGPEGVLVAIIAGAAVGMDPIAAMSGDLHRQRPAAACSATPCSPWSAAPAR
jgi:hypothetical protein